MAVAPQFDIEENTKLGGTLAVTGPVTGVVGPPSYGYVTLAVPDANVTLTAAQYVNGIIKVTGAITATRNVVAPLAAGAEVTFVNACTGAFSVQFIGPSGTGVTVANGKTAYLWSDGVNWYRTTPDT